MRTTRRMTRILVLLTLIMGLTGLVAACSETSTGDGGGDGGNRSTAQEQPTAPPRDAISISIAYSPEKEQWLQERIAAFHAQQPQLQGQPIVVEGINRSSGKAQKEIRDGRLSVTVWSPSASTWLKVLEHESPDPNVSVSSNSLVLTPVVISMWRPMAEAMGWPEESLGWKDMLDLINDPQGWGKFGHPEWGKFSWGHTDPEISTSALSTLLAEFYAAVGKQQNLTVQDVQQESSQEFIRDLGKGIKHYGYNTLVFSENMRKFGMSYISAFPMEEITLIEFNKNNPSTPLVAIYPEEGTFWHDDPYIVMATATPEQQQAADVFYDFLMTEESQQLAMSYGFRPANINVDLADPISPAYGVQPQGVQNTLDVPDAEVIIAARNAWRQNRKRADIILIVDTSSSMEGEKIELVKAGLESFLQRILPEDRVGLIAFANGSEVLVEPRPLSENLIDLQTAIHNLRALGNTALFNALYDARTVFDEHIPVEELEEDRIRAIVLLSDGADNASSVTMNELEERYEEAGISIFPVAYGEGADVEALERIAEFSRTMVVQGGTGDIAQIFENLSRYF